jgi:hypothetical protein
MAMTSKERLKTKVERKKPTVNGSILIAHCQCTRNNLDNSAFESQEAAHARDRDEHGRGIPSKVATIAGFYIAQGGTILILTC